MSRARSEFLLRSNDIDATLSDDSVRDGSLTDTIKNSKARVLRNGLAVVLFTNLEDFIRRRTSEILLAIGPTTVPFSSLPDKLRAATTTGLLHTLSFKLKLQAENDRLQFLQLEAKRIASTSSSPYELSPYALGYSRSNIDASDIKETLGAFMVDDAWRSMDSLASRLNYGSLPLKDAFMQAAARRHMAAHDATAVTLLSDLSDFLVQGRAIAASFDCLLSKAFSLIKIQDADYMGGNKIGAADCRVRQVTPTGKMWKHHVEGRKRAVSIHGDLNMAWSSAMTSANAGGDFVVQLGALGFPVKWAFPSAI